MLTRTFALGDHTSVSDPLVIAAIAGPVIAAMFTAVAAIWIDRKFYRRPKLITYWGHISTHSVPLPEGGQAIVNTHSVIVWNQGTATAHNIRVTVRSLQDIHFQIIPATTHHIENIDTVARAIVLPVLAPKQQVTIQFVGLNVPTAAVMLNCVCDEQVATHPATLLTIKPSRSKVALLGALMGAGAIAIVIVLAKLLASAWARIIG